MAKFFVPILIVVFFSPYCYSQTMYQTTHYKNFRRNKELKQTITPSTFKPELLNAAIFFATNEIRAKKGLSVLSHNPKLELSATIHSKDMADLDFFNHTNNKNKAHRTPDDRAKEAGITNPKLAENIIEGFIIVYKSGDGVIPQGPGKFLNPKTKEPLPYHTYLSLADVLLDNWMHSPGHRKNIEDFCCKCIYSI